MTVPRTLIGAVGMSAVPEAIRSLSPMTTPDYVDLFVLTTDGSPDRSPEEWARAALEDVAGLQGQFVWRVVLGLRLAWRAAPDRIAGWQIAGRGDGWIRLEARSWMLTGHLVVHVEEQRVLLATFARYDRWPAAPLWRRLSAVHRHKVPGILRAASRIVGRDR